MSNYRVLAMIATLASVYLASVPTARAVDARDPDPLSVVQAAFTVWNVGNVDAGVAFFTPDVSITNTRGIKVEGTDAARRWLQGNVTSNFQFSTGTDSRVTANAVMLHTTTTSAFYEKWGIAPVEVRNKIIVVGNRIQSFLAYYPRSAVARMEQACASAEGRDVSVVGRPCGEWVQAVKAYTEGLVAADVISNE